MGSESVYLFFEFTIAPKVFNKKNLGRVDSENLSQPDSWLIDIRKKCFTSEIQAVGDNSCCSLDDIDPDPVGLFYSDF